MLLQINKKVLISINVNETFPIYRQEYIDENHTVYYKFDSHHKVTRITDKLSEMSILAYDDERADFIQEWCNLDMINGEGVYSTLPEKGFDRAMERLINLIQRS